MATFAKIITAAVKYFKEKYEEYTPLKATIKSYHYIRAGRKVTKSKAMLGAAVTGAGAGLAIALLAGAILNYLQPVVLALLDKEDSNSGCTETNNSGAANTSIVVSTLVCMYAVSAALAIITKTGFQEYYENEFGEGISNIENAALTPVQIDKLTHGNTNLTPEVAQNYHKFMVDYMLSLSKRGFEAGRRAFVKEAITSFRKGVATAAFEFIAGMKTILQVRIAHQRDTEAYIDTVGNLKPDMAHGKTTHLVDFMLELEAFFEAREFIENAIKEGKSYGEMETHLIENFLPKLLPPLKSFDVKSSTNLVELPSKDGTKPNVLEIRHTDIEVVPEEHSGKEESAFTLHLDEVTHEHPHAQEKIAFETSGIIDEDLNDEKSVSDDKKISPQQKQRFSHMLYQSAPAGIRGLEVSTSHDETTTHAAVGTILRHSPENVEAAIETVDIGPQNISIEMMAINADNNNLSSTTKSASNAPVSQPLNHGALFLFNKEREKLNRTQNRSNKETPGKLDASLLNRFRNREEKQRESVTDADVMASMKKRLDMQKELLAKFKIAQDLSKEVKITGDRLLNEGDSRPKTAPASGRRR